MTFLSQKIVTLLSDFGLRDPYVAEMKAVILSIAPEALIVDISHKIEKFNIRMGAFTLASALPYFPKGTIHVAVVDPGVGTKRRPIIVETERSCLVGPDNGLLMLAAQREGLKHVYAILNRQFMLPEVSKTFHGRDIFAPAAAYLAKGHAPKEFGPEIRDYVIPKFAKPKLRKGCVYGEIVHVDDFGNIITNIPTETLQKMGLKEGREIKVKLGKDRLIALRFCSAYGQVAIREPLAIIGSHNFLEISVNQGNAAKQFKTKVGNSVCVSLDFELKLF
ncbi:MAG: S-adenosyl-l-methionine hydroxide adenosyltransferase family protein [Candidatus Bathyarchaeia archaeon]